MNDYAIILAAGQGTRMGGQIPKQYLEVQGHPILYYTIKAFQESIIENIVLVISENDRSYVERLVKNSDFTKVCHIVQGGTERYHSVYQGLSATGEADKVLIHDGARPLICPEQINAMLKSLNERRACAAGARVKDTIKIVNSDNYVIDTPERNMLWQIQTPQGFYYKEIKEAYDRMMIQGDTSITDDAMVMERYGSEKVYIMEMGYHNIKITTPEDLKYMEMYMKTEEYI